MLFNNILNTLYNAKYQISFFCITCICAFYFLVLTISINPELAETRKIKYQRQLDDALLLRPSLREQFTVTKGDTSLKARIENLQERLKTEHKAFLFVDKNELLYLLNKDSLFNHWQAYAFYSLTDAINIHIFYPAKEIFLLKYLPILNSRVFQWNYTTVLTTAKNNINLHIRSFYIQNDNNLALETSIPKSLKIEGELWKKARIVRVSPIGLIVEFIE